MRIVTILALLVLVVPAPLSAAPLSASEQAAVEQVCLQHIRPPTSRARAQNTSPFEPGFEDCGALIGENATEHAQKKNKADLDALKAATEKTKK